MMELLKKIFRGGTSADYAKLIKDGAVVLDVRTKGEYDGCHLQGSLNISLDQLKSNLHRLSDKQKPIITCCASGVRSAAAKRTLESSGYVHVYNGGSWTGLSIHI